MMISHREDLLIGRTVLNHLQVGTKNVLETNRAVLDGVHCSHAGNPTAASLGSYVNLVMVSRLNCIRTDNIADNSTYK